MLTFPISHWKSGFRPFQITVKTDNTGTSNDDQFTLPLNTGETYDCWIFWGDSTSTHQTTTTSPTHTYAAGAGIYQISITGTFPAIQFNAGGDCLKVVSFDNWGDVVWSTFYNAFYGCANMEMLATDGATAQTNSVTQMRFAFRNCTSMARMDFIDTSSVTNFYDTWRSTGLTSFPLLNVSSGTNFVDTWRACGGLAGVDFPTLSFDSMTNGSFCFAGYGISTSSYSALLVDLAANNSETSVAFNGGTATFSETAVDSGTTTATTASKLVEAGQNFDVTVSVGDIVHNTTDDTYAKVTAIDSATTLSLDTDIMVSGETFVVQSSDAAKARYSLVNDQSWTITDGGPV